MTVHFFPERIDTNTGFQIDWPQLALPSSLPDTYRLQSLFSGIPTEPMEALRRAGLAGVDAATGNLEFSLHAHATMGTLVSRGQIRWVNWTRPADPSAAPIPPGYVLTGHGELALTGYFELCGPAWPGRS